VTREEILVKYKDFKLPQQQQGYVANQFPRLQQKSQGRSSSVQDRPADSRVFTSMKESFPKAENPEVNEFERNLLGKNKTR